MDFLFLNGRKELHYPFLLICAENPSPSTLHQFGVSVRKKDYKRAVDRNLIKRRMRVCIRTHKEMLYESFKTPQLMMWVYVGKEIMDSDEMQKEFKKLINQLA